MSTSVTSPTRPGRSRSPSSSGQRQPAAEEALVRLVVQARGAAAELVDVPHDVGVDLLGQHAGDDLERGVVGVAPALDEARRRGPAFSIATVIALPPPWTTTGRMPDGLHEDDVDQQGAERLGVFHHRAAELDDREPAVELADVAERLDQDIRLADRFFMHEPSLRPQGLWRSDQEKQTTILSFVANRL